MVIEMQQYLTAFDKTGLPAKLNSTHLESLYSTLPTPSLFHSLPQSALRQAAQGQGYPTAQSLLPPSPEKPSG